MEFSERQSLAISYIRVLSVILIVNCHILQAIGNRWAWVLNVGVQIFFCMSGFLHAGKHVNKFGLFFWAKFKRIYIPYIIFFTVALSIYLLFRRDLITTKNLIGHILALQAFTGSPEGLGHLWFITSILICYLLTPITERLCEKYGIYFWCAVAFISFIWFWKISYGYNGCLWIFVYFLGYFSRRYIHRIGYILCILSLVLITIYPSYHIHSGNYIDYWMHAIGGTWLFLSIYYFSNFINHLPTLKGLNIIDNFSYEIYLTHHIFIQSPFDLINITKYFPVNLVTILASIAASSYLLKIISMQLLKINHRPLFTISRH